MDDVHRAHGTTGIVENPLLLDVQVLRSNLLLQLRDNEVDDGAGVLAMGLDGALREIVQVLRVEDVELLQARVEVAVDGGEQGQEDGQEAQIPDGEAAAAAAGAGRLLAGGFGSHWEGCWGGGVGDAESENPKIKSRTYQPLANPGVPLWSLHCSTTNKGKLMRNGDEAEIGCRNC